MIVSDEDEDRAARVNFRCRRGDRAFHRSCQSYLLTLKQAGDDLCILKQGPNGKYGRWLKFIATYLDGREDYIERLMYLSRNWPTIEPELASNPDLSFNQALALTKPSKPEPSEPDEAPPIESADVDPIEDEEPDRPKPPDDADDADDQPERDEVEEAKRLIWLSLKHRVVQWPEDRVQRVLIHIDRFLDEVDKLAETLPADKQPSWPVKPSGQPPAPNGTNDAPGVDDGLGEPLDGDCSCHGDDCQCDGEEGLDDAAND